MKENFYVSFGEVIQQKFGIPEAFRILLDSLSSSTLGTFSSTLYDDFSLLVVVVFGKLNHVFRRMGDFSHIISANISANTSPSIDDFFLVRKSEGMKWLRGENHGKIHENPVDVYQGFKPLACLRACFISLRALTLVHYIALQTLLVTLVHIATYDACDFFRGE